MAHGQIQKLVEIVRRVKRGVLTAPDLREIFAGRNEDRTTDQRREKTIHLLKIHGILARKTAEESLQAVFLRVVERLVERRPLFPIGGLFHSFKSAPWERAGPGKSTLPLLQARICFAIVASCMFEVPS